MEISPGVEIDENSVQFSFARAGGPGGQNVNKVETSVELRFAIHADPLLKPEFKVRLKTLAGKKVNALGELVIRVQEYRTQEQNRSLAWEKLTELLIQSSVKPLTRKKTKPGKAAREKRLEGKKKNSARKDNRRKDWE